MPSNLSEAQVIEALRGVRDPDLGRDIVSLGFIKDLALRDGNVAFTIELTTPACPVRDQMREEARRKVAALAGVKHVEIQMTSQVRSSFGPDPRRFVPQVRNVVPIASGKGGVGKSTVSANLALALRQKGARVGLLDADVYGPSIPTILGVTERPASAENRIRPVEKYGLKIMSAGFFMAENEAAIVRGPILHKMMEQFLSTVDWGELDYLLVDLPPGTGDVQLSLCQMIPLTGAAVVSTPQDVALKVAQKAILMFQKLNCPVLGLIENMSTHLCGHCGARDEIFGSGGVRRAAEAQGIPFLGELPLATAIRTASDSGAPLGDRNPSDPLAQAFARIAENLAAQISIRNLRGEANPEIRITY